MNPLIPAHKRATYAYLGTVLHYWIKEYSQRIRLEPQRLCDKINELIAQFLALCKVSQEGHFESGDILLFMPLK